jgi:hypothetical protein
LDPEPKGFRTLLVASTLTVLLAAAAGYSLWWLTRREADEAVPPPPVEADLSGVVLRPVDFAPGMLGDERARIDELVEAVVFGTGPRAKDDPGTAEQALLGQREGAVPRLLDAFHRLYAQDAFEGTATRRRAAVVDRVLNRIRRRMPGSPPPYGTALDGTEPGPVVERRAKAWFHWWETRPGATRPPR